MYSRWKWVWDCCGSARWVPLESAGRGKFTELVAHHVFRDVDRQEAAAIVHIKIQSDKVGRDRGAARPSLDRLAIIVGLCRFNLFRKVRIDKEAFFDGT